MLRLRRQNASHARSRPHLHGGRRSQQNPSVHILKEPRHCWDQEPTELFLLWTRPAQPIRKNWRAGVLAAQKNDQRFARKDRAGQREKDKPPVRHSGQRSDAEKPFNLRLPPREAACLPRRKPTPNRGRKRPRARRPSLQHSGRPRCKATRLCARDTWVAAARSRPLDW